MKMQPIMGALLGAIMISSSISGAEGLDFLGIPIPTNDYSSTVVPIVLGVVFMYFVDRGLQKIIPDITKLFLKPLLTMFIVVPVELIILGPAGSMMGYALSDAATCSWITWHLSLLQSLQPLTPILSCSVLIRPTSRSKLRAWRSSAGRPSSLASSQTSALAARVSLGNCNEKQQGEERYGHHGCRHRTLWRN